MTLSLLFFLALAVSAFLGVVGIATVVVLLRRRERDQLAWQDAALALGLHSNQASTAMHGDIGLHRASITPVRKGSQQTTRYRLLIEGLPTTVTISPRAGAPLLAETLLLGDEHLADAAHVQGDRHTLLVLLTPRNRLLLIQLCAHGLQIRAGRLQLETPLFGDLPTLHAALELARGLSSIRAAGPEALADRAREESHPGFKRALITALVAEAPESPVLDEALSWEDAEVRVIAANALGRQHVLNQVARDPSADLPARVKAALALLDEDFETLIIDGLSLPDLRERCLEALREIGTAMAVQPLLHQARGADIRMSRIAQEAVTVIQERIGADAGGLSLAETVPSEGELSIADDPPEASLDVS